MVLLGKNSNEICPPFSLEKLCKLLLLREHSSRKNCRSPFHLCFVCQKLFPLSLKLFPRCPGKNLSYWVSLAQGDQEEGCSAELRNALLLDKAFLLVMLSTGNASAFQKDFLTMNPFTNSK